MSLPLLRDVPQRCGGLPHEPRVALQRRFPRDFRETMGCVVGKNDEWHDMPKTLKKYGFLNIGTGICLQSGNGRLDWLSKLSLFAYFDFGKTCPTN